MEVPVGERLSLVLTGGKSPVIGQGELVRLDGDTCHIRLDPGSPAMALGDAVVLSFVNEQHPMVRGHVASIDGGEASIEVDGLQPRDQREFPRVESGVEVYYRVAPQRMPESALETWVTSGAAPPDGDPWRQPEPFMDLSASGLGFDDGGEPPIAGERLLIAFTLPGQKTPWRAIGHVVRVRPAGDGLFRVAVEFVRIPEDARTALMERTIELLRLPGEDDEEPDVENPPGD